MSEAFLAEIRIVGFNFAPRGWAQCNGQLMPIVQSTALFSLLGTMYGGNGQTTFALPDFQGRAPMHQGPGPGLSDRVVGETGGQDTVTLIQSEMPLHTHDARAFAGSGSQATPADGAWATAAVLRQGHNLYAAAGGTTMGPAALSPAGSGQPHNNLPPYLTLNFIIALQGTFPPRG